MNGEKGQVWFDFSEVLALSRDILKAAPEVRDKTWSAMRKTALDIQRDAKILAPVDTGFLRSSIRTASDKRALKIEIGPAANYGAYVEFGTSLMGPQPYMGPATERHVPLLESVLAKIGVEALP